MIVVRCRMSVEVADAEVGTATGFNSCSINRPLRSRYGAVTRDDARKREHRYKCKSSHTFTSFGEELCAYALLDAIRMSEMR
jgi:hypothetical protein